VFLPGALSSCADGTQNGNELGVDCGGRCHDCIGAGLDASTGNGDNAALNAALRLAIILVGSAVIAGTCICCGVCVVRRRRRAKRLQADIGDLKSGSTKGHKASSVHPGGNPGTATGKKTSKVGSSSQGPSGHKQSLKQDTQLAAVGLGDPAALLGTIRSREPPLSGGRASRVSNAAAGITGGLGAPPAPPSAKTQISRSGIGGRAPAPTVLPAAATSGDAGTNSPSRKRSSMKPASAVTGAETARGRVIHVVSSQTNVKDWAPRMESPKARRQATKLKLGPEDVKARHVDLNLL
jgi:hypothetical protein